jgi:hypothetical protein
MEFKNSSINIKQEVNYEVISFRIKKGEKPRVTIQNKKDGSILNLGLKDTIKISLEYAIKEES